MQNLGLLAQKLSELWLICAQMYTVNQGFGSETIFILFLFQV